jgi:hypothetical protein
MRTVRPEEEVVLLVAAARERRRATESRIRDLLDVVSWDALATELARQALLPLLGARILELAGPSAPAAFGAAVETETEVARKAGSLLELVTLGVARALEANGVPNVPLKGPMLARELHGDVAMRRSHDVDVLVAAGQLERATQIVCGLGWRVESGTDDAVLHVRLVHPSDLPDVELHWRVHWYETDFGARAVDRSRLGPQGVRRLSGLDLLAALLLFHARDGFAGLRHPTDVAAWWDARPPATESALLESTMREHPTLTRPLTASALVLEDLVGVPAASFLGDVSAPTWGARRAIRLANPLMRGSREQITAEISLVDSLLVPPGKRRAFLRRRALPSAAVLPPRSIRRPAPIARVEHVLRVLRRYPSALVRSRPLVRREK